MFIILNQVDAEKTLMKKVHMCYIGVTEGKIEKRQNELKQLYFHLHNTLSLPEGIHKIWKHWLV